MMKWVTSAARTNLEPSDHVERGEMGEGEDDGREQYQPRYEAREDGGRSGQEQHGPEHAAEQAQDRKTCYADFGDVEDPAAIRPGAGERRREQRHDARCIRVDGVEP